MLIDNKIILNRPTAKAVKRKDNKKSLRSSFVAFNLLRNKNKTSNASEAMRSDITCFGLCVARTYIQLTK
jgi:hypothetical protein